MIRHSQRNFLLPLLFLLLLTLLASTELSAQIFPGRITGTVTDVLIEEGDRVVAGQVLAHLDSTAQRAQLAQAQAQYHAAQATLGQTRKVLP